MKSSSFEVIEPFSIIAEPLERVQAVIAEQLCGHPQTAEIEQLLTHIRSRTGKMIRPGLLLLSGMCRGQLGEEHIRVAAIFEIIHEATLLHDDVVDEAHKRRGRRTVNSLYGNEPAVLLGDFLLSKVFAMSAELRPGLAKEIASAAGITCRGELNQNLQKKNWELSEKEYIEIISDKTAAIFSSCCRTGVELSGAGPDKSGIAENLALFGQKFGIAFQIADDILDIAGDENKAGKTLGTDFFEAKPTLPLIYLLGRMDNEQRRVIIELIEGGTTEARGELAAIMSEDGCLEYSRRQVQRYIDEAAGALESVPEVPAKKALLDTASRCIGVLSRIG